MQVITTRTPVPAPPLEILSAAHLLSRISGYTAEPVYHDGAWLLRVLLSREDAAALISSFDHPKSFPRLVAPILQRCMEATR